LGPDRPRERETQKKKKKKQPRCVNPFRNIFPQWQKIKQNKTTKKKLLLLLFKKDNID
jgi:hypothetical protein